MSACGNTYSLLLFLKTKNIHGDHFMSNYRIVGSFTAEVTETPDGKTETKFVSSERKRHIASTKPVDITASYSTHQPINLYSSYSEYRGFVWGTIKLSAGQVWSDWDGQRIIIEASARRIIYLKYSGAGEKRLYLQAPSGFITNITVDTVNRKAAQKTRLTKRLAEWEIHFLTGFLGASHWIGLVAVLGTDVISQVMGERKRNTAYKESVRDIIEVDRELKGLTPVLRQKLLEVLLAGASSNPGEKATKTIKGLSDLVVNDDKTTGRIAGAIAAKFILNPSKKNLTWLFIFQTIIVQIGSKSFSKVPPAVGSMFSDTFKQVFPNIEGLDTNNPEDLKKFANHLMKTTEELGVIITPIEAYTIVDEIKRNPHKVMNNFVKLSKAFERLANADS